ncbi:MAG: PorV/PorQ family protein, partial [Gammaproteobacteria bacterium]|nr:PorV/PorQ family protein [Gammaproteobacteria bacterium]
MKSSLLTAVLILFTSQIAFAQFDYGFDFSKAGTAGLQFLKIGVGAKHTGMGEASSSIVNDASSVFWNPAGLAWMEQSEVFLSYSSWLVNSKHTALSVALPVSSFNIAVSVISLQIEDFEETTVQTPTGTGRMVSAGDILFGVSIAKAFTNKLSIGGQIKFVQEKLDDVTFNNILFDIGTIYFTGWRDLRLAFSLQHFGPDKKMIDQKFKMPLLFRVGLADHIYNGEEFRVTLAADLVHPTDNNEWVNFGLETKFIDIFAVRSGYRLNADEGNLTLGFGITSPVVYGLMPKFD